jgi:hypothetical protein
MLADSMMDNDSHVRNTQRGMSRMSFAVGWLAIFIVPARVSVVSRTARPRTLSLVG